MERTSAGVAPAERLWNRDFGLFLLARSASQLGDMMLPVAITVAVLQSGHGASGVGYALAAHLAPFAVFVVAGGVLTDRFDPLVMMVGSDVARMVLQGVLAVALWTGDLALWQLLVLLALVGLGSATFQPGVARVVPQLTRQVQQANAALEVAESVMIMLGPAVAGVLVATTSPSVAFAADAATFGVSALCLLLLRGAGGAAAPVRRSLRHELAEGWREFRGRTWLWATVAAFMLGALTVGGPNQTLGFSTIVVEHGKAPFGAVMSVFGLGCVLGGLVAARVRPRRPLRTGAVVWVGVVFAPLVVALDLPVPWIAAGYAVSGAAGSFWLVMFHTAVQTHVPVEVLGRVHAYDVAGSLLMAPVGRAVAGPVGEWLGPRTVLVASTAMGAVVCMILLSVRPIRRLGRGDADITERTTG